MARHPTRAALTRLAAARAELGHAARAALWLGALCTVLAVWHLVWPSRPRWGDDLATRLLRSAFGPAGPGLGCVALALCFYAYAARALWKSLRLPPR